ncbi:tellurite resistance protein TehB [compost metagenome]|uniref:class I SAM-dependent methyltransferase n=1 Tax=Pseudomonas TaxID=286 RepID=UPI00048B58AF|nr:MULTISPECIES: class I SAM-dependent methyltransferase [Pseudomonas]MCW2271934.1 SAM-dependent methyltransferase [Pseudomonas sp. JUb96]PRA63043.1 class I SAM-dependent methyltransferase [Pseudomonas sp. MYb187]
MTSWSDFYKKTEKRGISPLLSRALQLAPEHGDNRQAIDLGCGAGNEARQLLEAGWHVLAIDNEPEAIARTTATCSGLDAAQLTTWLMDFEQIPDLPQAMLIHAGLSLPFCRPDRFQHLWDQILNALKPGGVFAGHLFGVRHGWSAFDHLSFHTEQEIRSLCDRMDISLLRESETLMEGRSGPLNWHRFNFVVTKPTQSRGTARG